MHPKHERARVLDEALRVAVEQLQDPIEDITVARDHILVTTRSGRLRLGYDYAQGLSSDRQHMPGSGHWNVWIERGLPARRTVWERLLRLGRPSAPD